MDKRPLWKALDLLTGIPPAWVSYPETTKLLYYWERSCSCQTNWPSMPHTDQLLTPSFTIWLGCELVLALICTEEQHDATGSTVKWSRQDTCPQMWEYTVSFLSYCAMEGGEYWSESCVREERKEGECALQLSLFVKQRLLILCLRLCGCRIGAKSGGTVTWLQWTRFHPKFQDDNPDSLSV